MTHKGPEDPPVVLVDDEPLVRMTAVDELEEAGFHVLEARSDEVQVLFTDVDMPGSMDGMALADQVHQRWPHIRLLIASGHARPYPYEIPDNGRFVPKPYRGATLVPQIAEMVQPQHGP
jgi:two-component system, response regulator PdtaR